MKSYLVSLVVIASSLTLLNGCSSNSDEIEALQNRVQQLEQAQQINNTLARDTHTKLIATMTAGLEGQEPSIFLTPEARFFLAPEFWQNNVSDEYSQCVYSCAKNAYSGYEACGLNEQAEQNGCSQRVQDAAKVCQLTCINRFRPVTTP
ncbi:hypothetical protein FE810_09515 [Thalassotalea litorea]|uniref:Lipoprotein n=1 Tax=Thalassotalea litorea TaxID=2020715 RepID=A0A5R9IKN9_9GAMM|nr:hypothetical protein [Thalassotalea litorea]TLU65149.1 hypothetical protein FE810_09515 [Thalassotalea litorea]